MNSILLLPIIFSIAISQRKDIFSFLNSVSEIIKNYNGRVIKNIGDCLLFYFPKTTGVNNVGVFIETIECGFKI